MADWSRDKGIERISKYCAYQERCHQEVQTKLRQLGCPWDEAQEILTLLIEEGFLNEERFAHAFAKGKFNQNAWGRIKIQHALRGKHIHQNLIDRALAAEIDEETYRDKAKSLIEKRLDDPNDWKARQKVFAWMQGRGYETEVIKDALEELAS